MLEDLLRNEEPGLLNNFTKAKAGFGLIDDVKSALNITINYPKIFEENVDGTITVQIFGVGENGVPVQRQLIVTDENINNLSSNKLKFIKKQFEKELGGKLDKYIKNKKYRMALYYTFFRLSFGISHIETIQETAFYIKEMYGE